MRRDVHCSKLLKYDQLQLGSNDNLPVNYITWSICCDACTGRKDGTVVGERILVFTLKWPC